MSRATAEQYLQMWLSEQIPTSEWMRILKERADVNEIYEKHLERKNNE
jgi:hypothetical protein